MLRPVLAALTEKRSLVATSDKGLSGTIAIIHTVLPMLDELIADIRSDGGHSSFASQFAGLLAHDSLPAWSMFYEDALKLKSLLAYAYLGLEEAASLEKMLIDASPEERKAISENIKSEILTSDWTTLESEIDSISIDQAQEAWDELGDTERIDAQKSMYLMLYGTITQINYYLALITFGENICSLVTRAKSGDDDAFCKVVQIDRTVLFGIPYFKKRLIRAQVEGDAAFLNSLANAIKGKPLGKKFSYPTLLIVFAILDDEGFLSTLRLEQIMDICEEVGVYGKEFGIEDVDSLRKRLSQYKKRTGRQIAF